MEQAGNISHCAAATLRLELDTKFFEQQLDAEIKKAQTLLKIHQNQFLDEQARIPGLKKDVETTRSTLAEKESTKTKFDDDAKRAEEALAANRKITAKFQEAHDSVSQKREKFAATMRRERPDLKGEQLEQFFRETPRPIGASDSDLAKSDAFNRAASAIEAQTKLIADQEAKKKKSSRTRSLPKRITTRLLAR